MGRGEEKRGLPQAKWGSQLENLAIVILAFYPLRHIGWGQDDHVLYDLCPCGKTDCRKDLIISVFPPAVRRTVPAKEKRLHQKQDCNLQDYAHDVGADG